MVVCKFLYLAIEYLSKLCSLHIFNDTALRTLKHVAMDITV